MEKDEKSVEDTVVGWTTDVARIVLVEGRKHLMAVCCLGGISENRVEFKCALLFAPFRAVIAIRRQRRAVRHFLASVVQWCCAVAKSDNF